MGLDYLEIVDADGDSVAFMDSINHAAIVGSTYFTAAKCREAAAWLTRAADQWDEAHAPRFYRSSEGWDCGTVYDRINKDANGNDRFVGSALTDEMLDWLNAGHEAAVS